uniref:Glucocorticoid receptor n=1 Tax=Pantodon buchholzi TaxID=8276 RepID=I6QAH2_PANBU|nr:glucocorticoid receptor 2b [Pantodon buchholzi]
MDQKGVKRSNNQDDRLTLTDYVEKEGGAFRSGVTTMSVASSMVVAPPNSRRPVAPGDVSNGLGGVSQDQLALSVPLGLLTEEATSKGMAHEQKVQQSPQHLPGLYTVGESFSRLEASIADFNRSNIDSLIGGTDPDLFPLKSEDLSPMGKDDIDLDQEPFGQVGKDSDKIFSENTLDILQDFDLTGSPSEFYVGDDAAFLTSLTADDSLLGDIVPTKETKPLSGASGHSNGGNRTSLSSPEQQVLEPSATSPVVKMEKEAYIQLCTPGVIKQENNPMSYCSISGSPISICGVSTSGGPSYHFGVSASTAVSMQQQQLDQKPVFMYRPGGDGWGSGQAYGETSEMQRGSENFSSSPAFPSTYISPVSSSNTSVSAPSSNSSSGKSSGPAQKICLVCSDEASGCHYGVLTCGSCKVFFKRAVEGQHNYLCAGRNDCIIDKIRRKNCPACRFRKCLQAGMNLEARKNKKQNKLKGPSSSPVVPPMEPVIPPRPEAHALVPKSLPQLTPTMLSLLKAIEPETVYAGYDSTLPDTSTRLMTTLNRLGGRQVVSAVKWAKALPGFRNLHLDGQMTLLQYSWLFLMSFGLGWRSFQQCNGTMLCFAPDLVINEERMKLPYMSDQCEQMMKIANEFVRLQISHDEYLCMKVLLLLSTVPKDGLKSQAVFDEIRMSYIKELGKAIVKREENSSQNWQRFYQLTKLLDSMHDLVGGLLNFCFYTFVNKSLSVEFPEMLAEIISNQLPKFKAGSVKPLLFHQK